MGFDHFHYVPVIKWKQGEQRAIEDLDSAIKSKMTPLVEIVEIAVNPKTGKRVRTPDEHAKSGVDALVKSCGPNNQFMLDCRLAATDILKSGVSLVDAIYDLAASEPLDFVPVVRLDATPTEFAAARRHLKRGLCLRVAVGSALEPEQLPSAIRAALGLLGASKKDVDLVVDLGTVMNWLPAVIIATITVVINAIPGLADYRTLTVVASNFPAPLPVRTNATGMIPRTEYAAWLTLFQKVTKSSPPFVRMPTFGDYCIQHPDGVEGLDYRVIDPPAAIRYTVRDEWYISKNQSVRRFGGGQFQQLAASLLASGHFYGAEHCKGCEDAKKCSQGKISAGSLGVWRRLGTTHHLTVAVQELQALAAP